MMKKDIYDHATDAAKQKIRDRLKLVPKFYIYCSACGKFLGTFTRFHKYIACYDCRNAPIRYFNQATNPKPSA
jgi:ribosomal protein S27E